MVTLVTQNPINIMILLDESLKLFFILIIQPLNIYLHSNIEIENTFGQNGCLLMHFFLIGTSLAVVNQFFGGFFITLMRFLYIRANFILTWVGEKFAATIVVFAYITAISFFTVNYIYRKDRIWQMDSCLQGLEKYKIFVHPSPRVVIFSLALVVVAELLMNVWICYIIYQQDKEVRYLINHKRYQRRNMKNAVDVFCHMLHFVLEILMTLFIILGTKASGPQTIEKEKLSEAIGIIYLLTGGIIPVIVISLSETLRQELSTALAGISCTFAAVAKCGKNDSGQVDTGGLQYLPFTEWNKHGKVFHIEMKERVKHEVENFKVEQKNNSGVEMTNKKVFSKLCNNSKRQNGLPGVPDNETSSDYTSLGPIVTEVQADVHSIQRK